MASTAIGAHSHNDPQPHSGVRIEAHLSPFSVTVRFHSSSKCVYSLLNTTKISANDWMEVPGQTGMPGTGGLDALTDTNIAPAKFYQVGVSVPE